LIYRRGATLSHAAKAFLRVAREIPVQQSQVSN
jgi:hypothetical protein